MKVWICAIAKMEELYIREWIEWHKKIGIDHIIIGDNNDSNYDKPLQPIIKDYIDEGYVELINKNDVLAAQNIFYNEIYQLKKDKFDWIGFIDIDEFIELPAYNNDIHLFLDNDKLKDIDAVIFPWLNYGDNEYLYYEDKPVKERFNKPIYLEYTSIKYFIKSLNNIKKLISIHNPTRLKTIDNCTLKCCDSLLNQNFIPNYQTRFDKYGNSYQTFSQIIVNKEYYNNAYISHYITKSTEEFIKYKILRGRCDRKIGNYDVRYNQYFYYSLNTQTKEKDELFNKYQNIIDNSINKQLEKYHMI